MQSLYKQKEKNYKKLRYENIKANITYISHFNLPLPSPTPTQTLATKHIKSSIPLITKMPRYILYTHSNQIFYTKDDNILRFIPYIHKKGKIEGCFYDSISFASQKISKNLMIVRASIKDILLEYNDDEIYNVIMSKNDKNIMEIVKLGGFTMDCVIEWIAELFYRSRRMVKRETDLMDYFCGVCYLFNCSTHEIVKDFGIRKSE